MKEQTGCTTGPRFSQTSAFDAPLLPLRAVLHCKFRKILARPDDAAAVCDGDAFGRSVSAPLAKGGALG